MYGIKHGSFYMFNTGEEKHVKECVWISNCVRDVENQKLQRGVMELYKTPDLVTDSKRKIWSVWGIWSDSIK
jgi:hypothetical protein